MGNRVIDYVPVKQGIYVTRPTAQGDIGSVKRFEDGRIFVYARNGAAALEPGIFVQGPAESGYDESLALAADIADGDKTVSITVDGSRAYTANELQDGWIIIDDVDSGVIGHARKIKSHPVGAINTTLVLTLYDAWTDTATTAASDTVSVTENPYNGVIKNPATTTGILLGVPVCHVEAAYYFWVQVGGPAPATTSEATLVVGDSLIVTGENGLVIKALGADDEFIGWAIRSAATDGDAIMIWLAMRK